MSAAPRRLALAFSRRATLRLRFSLILTLLAAGLLLAGAAGWLRDTRLSIGEEVESASQVARQWLTVAARGAQDGDALWTPERLLAHVAALGRIRANELQVLDADGVLRYRSPGPTYKAGRNAPDWFAAYLTPPSVEHRLPAGALTLVLLPDSSRAVLDAWDDLQAFAAWGGAALAGLFAACWLALRRALRPLGLVMRALERFGNGRFDTRLPVPDAAEIGQLAQAFNGMADRLDAAVAENIRLGREQALAHALKTRLEAERAAIARELHDELAQGITAVRALAGAIAQRSVGSEAAPGLPAVHAPALGIVAVTGQMQDGVRAILHRLRPDASPAAGATLGDWLAGWRQQHPEIALHADLDDGAPRAACAAARAPTLLRLVQESLTNVVRHAGARHVAVRLRAADGGLLLEIEDDGCGTAAACAATRGSGLGLRGMRERVALLGGRLEIGAPRAGSGTLVRAWLPEQSLEKTLEDSL